MYIYNVTVKLAETDAKEWLHWMKTKHIPDVIATGFFSAFNILEVTEPVTEANTKTYTIQYRFSNMKDYKKYQETAAPALQKEHTKRYANKFVAFRSILKFL